MKPSSRFFKIAARLAGCLACAAAGAATMAVWQARTVRAKETEAAAVRVERREAAKQARETQFEAWERRVREHPDDIPIEDFYVAVRDMSAQERLRMWETLCAVSPERVRARYRGIFLIAWAMKSPRTLFAFGETLPRGRDRAQVMQIAAGEWAKREPKALAEWIERNRGVEYHGDIERARRALIGGWAETDPDGALAYARQMRRESPQDRSVYQYALATIVRGYMGNGDVAGALAVCAADPGGGNFSAVKHAMANAWGRVDPVAAMAWARGLDATEKSAATETVLDAWAYMDSRSALEWARGLDAAEPQRAEWTGRCVSALAETDVDAAAKFINGLEAGAVKDESVSRFLRRACDEDPSGAFAWTWEIGDAKRREHAQSRVMESWIRTDPAAARAFLESGQSPFAPERRAAFERLFDMP